MPRAFVIHTVLETLAYFSGATLYAVLRARRGDTVGDRHRLIVLVGAAIGAAIGSRLLVGFEGKTIVGGLLGGLIGVELTKKIVGVTRSTGDLLVLPLIAAMCIGRIGCFLAGPADHTAGLPSNLPWAIAMGDDVPRHPVALYEIAFLLLLAPIAERMQREGDKFKVFLASYLAFRFLIDFLKPEPQPLGGVLTAIQWACLAGLAYYASVFMYRRPAVPIESPS